MALTRKMLKGMGLTDEQIDTVIEAHTETVDGLKAQISEYKADAEKLSTVQKELDKTAADLEAEKKSSWKVKYDALKEEYEGYKSEQSKKETHAAKRAAYKALLQEAGVSEKRMDAVLKVTDVDSLELGEDSKVKDSAKVLNEIKAEWSDFIQTTSAQGANTPNPPSNNGGSMSRSDILKIKDPAARQKAIAENITQFTGKE